MLRATLITTVCLSAMAVPALAAGPTTVASSSTPWVSGDIDAAGGGVWSSGYGAGAFSADARAALPVTGMLRFEAELRDRGLTESGESVNSFAGVAHLYAQNSSYAFGIFGGAGSFDYLTNWTVGGEAQAYFAKLTLDGAVAFQSFNISNVTGWSARLGGHYYVTPNNRLSLTGLYYSFSGGNLTGAEAAFEHRFTNTPWSAFAKATWLTESGYSETAVLGGIRISLDNPGSTLQSHDKAVPWESTQSVDTLFLD